MSELELMSPDRCIGLTGFETRGFIGLLLVHGIAAASLFPNPAEVNPVLEPILRSKEDDTADDVEEGLGKGCEEDGRREEVLLTMGDTCNVALPVEELLEELTVGEEAGGVEEAALGVLGVEEAAGVFLTKCEMLLTLEEEGVEEEVQKPLD